MFNHFHASVGKDLMSMTTSYNEIHLPPSSCMATKALGGLCSVRQLESLQGCEPNLEPKGAKGNPYVHPRASDVDGYDLVLFITCMATV